MASPEPFRILDEELVVIDSTATGGRGQPERFRIADETGLNGARGRIEPGDLLALRDYLGDTPFSELAKRYGGETPFLRAVRTAVDHLHRSLPDSSP